MEARQDLQLEVNRRYSLWSEVRARDGGSGVAPAVLRELDVYGGAQGVWVNKARTGPLSPHGVGIAVGLQHTGRHYADDLWDGGLLYHYPVTGRNPGRDASEIEATKEACRYTVPVFVILPGKPAARRRVRIGWVRDWDDDAGLFLVEFGESPSATPVVALNEEDERAFELEDTGRRGSATVATRLGQGEFKFRVLRRYGPRCCLCNVEVLDLLDAAHLRPKQKHGTDDPRNGLVLCANHHRAFDRGLFNIEPETLRIVMRTDGPTDAQLGIDRTDISHLKRRPHLRALEWRWNASH